MANDRMRPRKRRKVCSFCVDKITQIDYKDTAPPYHRHLCRPSASVDHRHQAGPSDRAAALRGRLRQARDEPFRGSSLLQLKSG